MCINLTVVLALICGFDVSNMKIPFTWMIPHHHDTDIIGDSPITHCQKCMTLICPYHLKRQKENNQFYASIYIYIYIQHQFPNKIYYGIWLSPLSKLRRSIFLTIKSFACDIFLSVHLQYNFATNLRILQTSNLPFGNSGGYIFVL